MRPDRSRSALVLAVCVTCAVAMPATAGATAAAAPTASAHALDRSLPPEPLMAFSATLSGDRVGGDELQQALGRLLDEGRRAQLTAWIGRLEGAVGIDLDRQLLPAIGPNLAVSIDFPPIDGMFAITQLPDAGGLAPLLAGCGAVTTVRDRAALDALLSAIAARSDGEPEEIDGVRLLRFPLALGTAAGASTLTLYHAVRDDVLAVGFDAAWVRRAVAPGPDRVGLADGGDFSRVFANLDDAPGSWSYVNLPRVRRWLAESQIIALLVAGDATVASIVQPLLEPSTPEVGVGWTTITRDGGVRTSRFGPVWTSGLALSGGVLAAMVLAETGDTDGAERAAIRETLGTIREISEACEQFSADIDGYPGPTDGWVPVERIAMFLEPVYAPNLPRTDAWHNPILYWSDGDSYRLISLGRDGRMDRDWSTDEEVRPGESPDSDILFADGRFVVLPPQIVSE